MVRNSKIETAGRPKDASVPAREPWEEFPPTLGVDETWRIPVRTPTHTA
jgi:hypothetical protein